MFQVESVSDRLICKNSFWGRFDAVSSVGTNSVYTDRVIIRLNFWIDAIANSN